MKARHLGLVAYVPTWRAMQACNAARIAESEDQLWLLEHPPVFTLGLAGRPEHVLAPGAVPVVKTDRGGQVTYHGPGQAIAYVLLDLKRARLGVRELVRRLEGAVVEVLANHGITGVRREGMPGVYVGDAKIAAVGLRIARGCSYHGLALNNDLDLSPFSRIDPCGYPGLAATSLERQGVRVKISALQHELAAALQRHLAP